MPKSQCLSMCDTILYYSILVLVLLVTVDCRCIVILTKFSNLQFFNFCNFLIFQFFNFCNFPIFAILQFSNFPLSNQSTSRIDL